MGGEYRLVSEDEWQELRSKVEQLSAENLSLKSERNWFEKEAARLEKEGLRLESEVYNLRWQYSHEDPNADEPEPEEAWPENEPCDGCAGCSCAENEQTERIARAVVDELMERLRAFVL